MNRPIPIRPAYIPAPVSSVRRMVDPSAIVTHRGIMARIARAFGFTN